MNRYRVHYDGETGHEFYEVEAIDYADAERKARELVMEDMAYPELVAITHMVSAVPIAQIVDDLPW